MTSLLRKTLVCIVDLEAIFRYNEDSAGRPHGRMLRSQLRWPANHCQERREGQWLEVFTKSLILAMMLLIEFLVSDMVPWLISTQKPMIFKHSPNSCFFSSYGQPIASQSTRSCAWCLGLSLPLNSTRSAVRSHEKKLSMKSCKSGMSSLVIANQHIRPAIAHQHWGEARFSKTRRRTICHIPSTLTSCLSCQRGCAGRSRKALDTSDFQVTRVVDKCWRLVLYKTCPKVLILSYFTFALTLDILLFRPEAVWSITTLGFPFCHMTNKGDDFIPGRRSSMFIGSDYLPALISLSQNSLIA